MEIRYDWDDWNPTLPTRVKIDQANKIIEEYEAQGFVLTLRQLYYQFVSKGWMDNTQREYKNLGNLMTKARMQGMVSWHAMEDRTRNVVQWATYASAVDAVQQARRRFTLEKWDRQPTYVEVWIEKEALSGVFRRVCGNLEVPFFACKGYTSLSEMWVAAQRLTEKVEEGKEVHILHFGDHDPSGIDMTRDIVDRLEAFEVDLGLTRMALNRDQVDRYNPPPNPAKLSDSRATEYVSIHGYDSWELDALTPAVLTELVRTEVESWRDEDLWTEAEEEEEHALSKFDDLIRNLREDD